LNVAVFPEAVALPINILPLVTVEAVKLPPVAATLANVRFPLDADSVIAPLKVVAEVTVSPPAVSETLIAPGPVTFNVALVAAVLTLIPVPAVIDTVVPDTSALLSTVAVTDVQADKLTLPLVDATEANGAKEIPPLLEVISSVPEVVETATSLASVTVPLAESDRLPVVVDKLPKSPNVIVPPALNEILPDVAATVASGSNTMLPLVFTVKLSAPKPIREPVPNVTAPGESFSVIAKPALEFGAKVPMNITDPPLIPDWSLMAIELVKVNFASRRAVPDTETPVPAVPDQPEPLVVMM
jgi:hypothetical protein